MELFEQNFSLLSDSFFFTLKNAEEEDDEKSNQEESNNSYNVLLGYLSILMGFLVSEDKDKNLFKMEELGIKKEKIVSVIQEFIIFMLKIGVLHPNIHESIGNLLKKL